MAVVYCYLVLDILHDGHLVHIRNARRVAGPDGIVIAGILTAAAVMEEKSAPILSFGQRYRIARALRDVDVVVAQGTYSPVSNVSRLRPDVLLESDSHSEDVIASSRSVMDSIGGKVLVMPYYPGKSSTAIKERVNRVS